jgi:hypothetical protein
MQVSCSIPVEEIVNISEQAGKAILQIYNSAVSTSHPTQELAGFGAVAAVFCLRLLNQCCSKTVYNMRAFAASINQTWSSRQYNSMQYSMTSCVLLAGPWC